MKKTLKNFPAPVQADDLFRSERPKAPLDVVVPAQARRQYRRGPFYLKIEGLDGPRPKYDAFGRIIAAGSED